MDSQEVPKAAGSPPRDDNSSTSGSDDGRSVEGPYRDFHDALAARRHALRRQRDEALGVAARAEEELRQLAHLDTTGRPVRGRGRRMLVGGAMLLAIAAPTFAAGYVVAAASATERPRSSVRVAHRGARSRPGAIAPSEARLEYERVVRAMDGAPQDQTETRRQIRQIDGRTWEVDEELFHRLLETRPLLGRPLQIIPHEEEGRIVGVKIFGFATGSVLDTLGFQTGDLIRRVNGIDISNPDAALAAHSRMQERRVHTVELERRGEVRHHVFVIR